jgi:hypothetical protein
MRLGADPEVFLTNHKQLISSLGLIGGTKQEPLQIKGLQKGFTLQEDNVTLEFGIPPASDAHEFAQHIHTVLQAGLLAAKGLSFSKLSCAVFPEDQMKHPGAFIFGCEPDFNAWTKEQNEPPMPPHPFMRSAGGHVHVETAVDPTSGVRACDLFLGVPSVLQDTEGKDRRQLYGKPGAFRFKPYGFEYRTLSNYWVFEDRTVEWVWHNTAKAMEFAEKNALTWCNDYGPLVQDCINTNDKTMAEFLIKEFDIYVC